MRLGWKWIRVFRRRRRGVVNFRLSSNKFRPVTVSQQQQGRQVVVDRRRRKQERGKRGKLQKRERG